MKHLLNTSGLPNAQVRELLERLRRAGIPVREVQPSFLHDGGSGCMTQGSLMRSNFFIHTHPISQPALGKCGRRSGAQGMAARTPGGLPIASRATRCGCR